MLPTLKRELPDAIQRERLLTTVGNPGHSRSELNTSVMTPAPARAVGVDWSAIVCVHLLCKKILILPLLIGSICEPSTACR